MESLTDAQGDMQNNDLEAKLKKYKKKLKKKKREIAILEEKYDSAHMMMSMTREYMANAQQEIEEKNQALKKSNKHLTDSIQYASRIQRAMFSVSTLERHGFPNTFILLKPKDVVSGDAPWFFRKNHLRLAAAIDCTGHGVPGAMLTVLTLSLLNQIITTELCQSPKEILLRLDQMIHSYLRSGNTNHKRLKDGLDISLVCYNIEDNTLRFVGAHRPLWIYQNDTLTKAKGNRYNLGDALPEAEDILQEQHFSMQPGDRVYLFTDGFPDQFGGPDNYKLMIGNFYKLVRETATQPLDVQKSTLSNFFDNWKGNQGVQTDDVLVIGLEF